MLKINWSRLAHQPLPAIAKMHTGDLTLVAKISGDGVLVHDPLRGGPVLLPRPAFEAAWTGRLVTLKPRQAAAAEGRGPRFGFAWFLPLIARHKGLLAQSMLASLLLQLFGLVTPLATMIVMDKVMATASASTLDVIVLGLLVTVLFEFAMGLARTHLLAYATNRIDVELSAALFRHLASLPLSYFDSRRSGAIAGRLRELEQIRAFLTGAAPAAFIDLVFTVVFLVVMTGFAPLLTGVVAAIVLTVVALYGVITPWLKARLAQRSQGGVDSQAFLVETVGGIETVKGMALEARLQRRWEGFVEEHTETAFAADRLSQTTATLVAALSRLSVVLTLWLGAHQVIAGSLSLGQLIGFNMMAGRVLAPAQRLGQLWQQFQQARVALRRVGEIFDQAPEPARMSAAALPDIRGRVTFRAVTFRYRPDRPEVLRRVSFDIRPGEVVGVVGASGSGKSTLAKLMLRLYVPQSGQVLVDGADLSGVDPGWLRRQVSLLPQDNFLFNASVRDNIALADPLIPMERLVAAARLAGAHEFIAALPEAYDT
ncbi:MAG TPA: ABC transporter transmembrane domain-containing protein, partial [Azospirillaceae bacterium]|nr:ABC transporter transmembrane domain-containing protein [Azospirillaceae bacterium]